MSEGTKRKFPRWWQALIILVSGIAIGLSSCAGFLGRVQHERSRRQWLSAIDVGGRLCRWWFDGPGGFRTAACGRRTGDFQMTDRIRPYLFYDVAVSICSVCYRKVEGKIVFESGKVFLLKQCLEHGSERILMADDVDYYRRCREVFIKPPEMPRVFNTPVKWGCPYDCGLCSDHQQHSCLSLVEICDYCNLQCPVCYAESGPARQQFRSLAQVERMLDAVVRNEREPDVIQISGGEPTLHPDFFRVLDMG